MPTATSSPTRSRPTASCRSVRPSLSPGLDLVEEGGGVVANRRDVQDRDAALDERGNPLLHVALGPDEVGQLEELLGNGRGRLVLLAVEVEVLDLLGLGLVAV